LPPTALDMGLDVGIAADRRNPGFGPLGPVGD
jgi:hypothetical protein